MTANALQRLNMVESQVRPSDVTDRRITSAMQSLPRELFAAENCKAVAYMDGALPVASTPGPRAMSAPRLIARLVQLLAIEPADRVLVVGALTGYAAAVVAGMAKDVVALECDPALTEKARANLAGLGIANVTCVTGALDVGSADRAPYDAILVDGGVERVPEALIAQLAQGGRLVAVQCKDGRHGAAIVITKTAHTTGSRIAFDATAPCLPGFAQPKAFVF